MKEYPPIQREIVNCPIYAFDKKDGSNIRSEWNRKQGLYKFGSRNRLLGEDQPFLTEAPDIIRNKYEKDLSDIFRKERFERVICFFEFWGPNSFAGTHIQEPHDVTLFDVNPHKKGILDPAAYLKLFGHLDICKLLYRGNCNSEFVELVRSGQLGGMTFEGVVCKAKNPKNTPMPIMFKVKNRAWVEKLKECCKGNDQLFNTLL